MKMETIQMLLSRGKPSSAQQRMWVIFW